MTPLPRVIIQTLAHIDVNMSIRLGPVGMTRAYPQKILRTQLSRLVDAHSVRMRQGIVRKDEAMLFCRNAGNSQAEL